MNADSDYNIASYLPRMAALQPETPAVHFPLGKKAGREADYLTLSYRQLNQRSDRIALGLERIGIRRGLRTVLMVKPSPDFFALTFGLFKVGAVPVLIDPGMGLKNLKTCLEEAAPEAFIGIPQAHAARILLGWGKQSIRILLTVGSRWFWGGTSLQRLLEQSPAESSYRTVDSTRDETAAILFTSGSTGVPKGAVYSHGNFLAQVEALRQVYHIEPGEIDLPTFPLFALFAPALGMTSVIPAMDFTKPGSVNPDNIIGAVQRFQATTMFGSPALIRRVGRYGCQHGAKLPSLKRVISAGAPVPAGVLADFTRLLGENVEIFTPYGATEALPVCSVGSQTILAETAQLTDLGKGVCVGYPVPGIELKIIRISDEALPEWSAELQVKAGEIGEIAVKGAQVTREYFHREESTRLAKIADPGGGFYHRMGDLGYCDDQGRIWFCGRKAHRVETTAETLFSIPCEAIFNTHPEVLRTALVGIVKGQETLPVICVELEPGHSQAAEVILEDLKKIAKANSLTQNIKQFLIHREFPVDIRHNAKIFREKLATWAQEQLS